MDDDPWIRALRRFSLLAGSALVITPLFALALEMVQPQEFRRQTWRDLILVLMPLSVALFGAVMLDVTLTISRVAERLAPRVADRTATPRRGFARTAGKLALILAAVLVAAGLVDRMELRKTESEMLERARQSQAAFATTIEQMVGYRFGAEWVQATADRLALMHLQGGYSRVTLIVRDSIDGHRVYLEFGSGASIDADKREPKLGHVHRAGAAEQAYLDGVFDSGHATPWFTAWRGSFTVLLPVQAGKGAAVLRFVDDGS